MGDQPPEVVGPKLQKAVSSAGRITKLGARVDALKTVTITIARSIGWRRKLPRCSQDWRQKTPEGTLSSLLPPTKRRNHELVLVLHRYL